LILHQKTTFDHSLFVFGCNSSLIKNKNFAMAFAYMAGFDKQSVFLRNKKSTEISVLFVFIVIIPK